MLWKYSVRRGLKSRVSFARSDVSPNVHLNVSMNIVHIYRRHLLAEYSAADVTLYNVNVLRSCVLRLRHGKPMDENLDWKLSADWQMQKKKTRKLCDRFAVLYCEDRVQPISGPGNSEVTG